MLFLFPCFIDFEHSVKVVGDNHFDWVHFPDTLEEMLKCHFVYFMSFRCKSFVVYLIDVYSVFGKDTSMWTSSGVSSQPLKNVRSFQPAFHQLGRQWRRTEPSPWRSSVSRSETCLIVRLMMITMVDLFIYLHVNFFDSIRDIDIPSTIFIAEVVYLRSHILYRTNNLYIEQTENNPFVITFRDS